MSDGRFAGVGRWVSIGPTLIHDELGATGRVTSIAIDPSRPRTIYCAGRSGHPGNVGGSGVWKTTDGGSSWIPIADDFPNMMIGAIALEPGRPSRIYAAALGRGEVGGGLFRSDNSGLTWELLVEDSRLSGRSLLIDPNNPQRMYIGTAGGVHRSLDGGFSWVRVFDPPGADVTDLAMDPASPEQLYAGVSHATSDLDSGVFATIDGGDNWMKRVGCPKGRLPTTIAGQSIRLAISRNRIYASFKKGKTDWTIYRTTDAPCEVAGQPERTWQQGWVAPSGVGKTIWSYLYAHPDDPDIVYATGTSFRRSIDAGDNFDVSSGPHVDHHAFAVDPEDGDTVYTGSDGGLYRSTDRGASDSWRFVGEGMTNTEFYDIGHALTDPDLVLGGTQDNGTITFRGSDTAWEQIRGGDGATVDVDPTDSTIVYSMGQYADSIERREGTSDWEALKANLPADSDCARLHFQVHPTTPSTLLASCYSLWRTTTVVSPGDWRMIFPPPDFPTVNGNVSRSAVDASTDTYYAATDGGELYAGVGGDDWERVFSSGTDCGGSGGIADMELDPDDPAVLYLAVSANEPCRIVRLRRISPGGLAMAAQDITTNLPVAVIASSITVDRVHPGILYVGTTDRAVYRGRRGGGSGAWTWSRYSDGLPFATCIAELVVHPTTGVLRAGTTGRGAFEVYTEPPIGSVLAIDGVPIYLRAHDAGGYGPPNDRINGEAIVRLDSAPHRAFGFQLRDDTSEGEHLGMLDVLRSAFVGRQRVRIDYVRTGLRNGRAFRVAQLG
jgi:photosystem II stability/assembly factor-like uncharacterized protein